jgi:2,3-bisphosphoglycerate-dependent phosphoglycerate mutase
MVKRTFYFIRHGETDWNRLNQFQGHTDVPLNENGMLQAYQKRASLLELGLKAIVSSPLKRARDTAELLNGELKLPFSLDPGLKECGCPHTAAQIYQDLGLGLPDFSLATMNVPESKADFIARSIEAVERALNATKGPPLIVAHGGTYWALCHHLGQVPGRIPNCTPVCFEPIGEGWRITVGSDPRPKTSLYSALSPKSSL